MKFFKKITDERLLMKQLKHIRIAHIVQTLGIIIILVYEAVTKGIEAVYGTPLWWVFRLTITVLLLSAASMSIEHDTKIKSARRFIFFWSLFALILAVGAGIISTNQVGLIKGFMLGILSFVIAMIPGLFIWYLLKKKEVLDEDQ